MARLAEPHGGVLVDRLVLEQRIAEVERRATRLPQLTLDARETADLELIATGAASPLEGFLGLRDYQSVLHRLRLADGVPWPVPFTLAVTVAQMASVLQHGAAALRDRHGRLRAIVECTEAYVRDPRAEALALYGTDDPTRRGVAYLLSRPTGIIAGPVTVLPSVRVGAAHAATPRAIRTTARRQRWMGLTGVATKDGAACLQPVGAERPGLFAVPPVATRYAAGRDAFLQAIVLKNFGVREVFFECSRAEWDEASPAISPQDIGVTPIWVLRAGLAETVHRDEFVAA